MPVQKSLETYWMFHVCVYSHGLSKVWFKITGKEIPSHPYSVGNIYMHSSKNMSLKKTNFFFISKYIYLYIQNSGC